MSKISERKKTSYKIGDHMNEEEKTYIEIKRLNKVVDKLEKRIATLEKVLDSHAKCIGELRGKEND